MSKHKHNQQFKDEYEASWPVLKRSRLSAHHAYCSVCDLDLNIAHGGRDDCRRHMECARHVQRAKAKSTHKDLKSMFVQSNDLKVVRAESYFTAFLIEHNIPISASDHAGPLFRKMFPESPVAAKYGCARTKTTAIIKSFSDSTSSDIANSVKTEKFALSTDGSNSSQNEKIFPLVISYFDESQSKIVNMLLSLPRLNGDSTGENIFHLLDDELKKFSISWENCVAFGSDNASNMTGKFKGVIKYIKEKNPNCILKGCACHLVHLVAQHSSKRLDFPIEEFLVDIFYYLKKSTKRVEAFKLCQELCEVETHKILKYGSTRWLSMERVVNRILEQWEPLKMFFCETDKGKSDSLLRIQSKFQDPLTYLYLLFLQSVLPVFNKANTFLQHEAPLIHKLRREFLSLYTGILSQFVKPSTVVSAETVFDIAFGDRKVQKSREEIVIGSKAKQYLNNPDFLNDTQKTNFFYSVRAFYVKACTYIVKNFPINDELLQHAEVADIGLRTQTSFKSVVYFINLFGTSEDERNRLEIEFAQFQVDKLNAEILSCDREDTAWLMIKSLTDHNKSVKYKHLPKMMLNILLLPHSNAACERVFSTVRKNQTEFRSNLGRETLEAIMIEKCKFSSQKLCCHKLNFSDTELLKAKKATNLSVNK